MLYVVIIILMSFFISSIFIKYDIMFFDKYCYDRDYATDVILVVVLTQIGNNFGYLHGLHFLASYLYLSRI